MTTRIVLALGALAALAVACSAESPAPQQAPVAPSDDPGVASEDDPWKVAWCSQKNPDQSYKYLWDLTKVTLDTLKNLKDDPYGIGTAKPPYADLADFVNRFSWDNFRTVEKVAPDYECPVKLPRKSCRRLILGRQGKPGDKPLDQWTSNYAGCQEPWDIVLYRPQPSWTPELNEVLIRAYQCGLFKDQCDPTRADSIVYISPTSNISEKDTSTKELCSLKALGCTGWQSIDDKNPGSNKPPFSITCPKC